MQASVAQVVELARAARFPEALRLWSGLGPVRLLHPALLEIGAALHEQLRHGRDAIELWERLHALRADDPRIVASLVDVLLAGQQEERAREVLVSFVVAHRGRDPDLEARAAELLARDAVRREEGRDVAGARLAAEAAVDLAPGNVAAARVLVRLDHQAQRTDAARDRALALLAGPLSDRDRSALNLELALIERRRGDVDAAFAAAVRGKALAGELHRAAGIDRDHYPQLLARIAGWTGRWPRLPADERADPVLMVGFPRSGTTLLQQILQAHPRVQTLDESGPALAVLRAHFGGAPARYPDCLERLTDADWGALRAAYFAQIDALELPDHDVLVDKLPLNLVRLDYLVRLFPRARVLVSVRDPRDVVLSNFFQDFEANAAMAQFTDLADTARTYAAVMDLWLARRATLPVRWREQRYEDLAADTEAQARELLAFLGVAWDPAVLAHHEAAAGRKISTPSRYDASRPVYRDAVGRWRAFAEHLAPVLPRLTPFVRAFGYADDATG